MLWTLYRYIAKDLLINFTLCLVGLTTVLALGGVLVRMRQEGLDSKRILLLFSVMVPVMLTITLPFASLFAATLVYGRMSSHNEINACRAGGISLGKLMYPALALAVLTGLTSVYMAMYWIPMYTREIEVVLRRDVTRVVMSRLRSRGVATIGGQGTQASRIVADWAIATGDRPLMRGVLALTDSSGRERQVITADSLEMIYDEDTGAMTLKLRGPWGTPQGRQFGADGMVMQTSLPPQFTEKVKYKNWDELQKLRDAPVDDVDVKGAIRGIMDLDYFRRFYELFQHLYNEPNSPRVFVFSSNPSASSQPELAARLRCRLASPGPTGSVPGTGWLNLPDPTIEVFSEGYEDSPASAPVYRYYKARVVQLEPEFNYGADRCSMRLRLMNVTEARERVVSAIQDSPIRQIDQLIEGLEMIPKPPAYRTLDWGNVYRFELPKMPDTEAFNSARQRIDNGIRQVLLNIDAEIHSRIAMGACCLLFVFLGAGLGVLCRTGDYIVALAVSVAPGALTLGVIVLGRRVLINMENPVAGVLTIWGGPLLLLIANVVLFQRLLRR